MCAAKSRNAEWRSFSPAAVKRCAVAGGHTARSACAMLLPYVYGHLHGHTQQQHTYIYTYVDVFCCVFNYLPH